MGNLFSSRGRASTAADPFSNLLTALSEAIPLLSSTLKPMGARSGENRLSSLLQGIDSQALLELVQRFAGTLPALAGIESKKE